MPRPSTPSSSPDFFASQNSGSRGTNSFTDPDLISSTEWLRNFGSWDEESEYGEDS